MDSAGSRQWRDQPIGIVVAASERELVVMWSEDPWEPALQASNFLNPATFLPVTNAAIRHVLYYVTMPLDTSGAACAAKVMAAIAPSAAKPNSPPTSAQSSMATDAQTAQWTAVCGAIISYIVANAVVTPGGTMLDSMGAPVTGTGTVK
jgi:hypothetical protein